MANLHSQSTNQHKPSARQRREPISERPSARAPVARGVFGRPTERPEVPEPRRAVSGTRSRSAATQGGVLVTGICGRLGRLLARELHRTDRVVGGDRRSFDVRPKDIVHHQIDMRRKKMKDIFRSRDIRAVVHLGIIHDLRRSDQERHSWNIVAFQKLLDYMSQYDVPKLVVPSVYRSLWMTTSLVL